MLLKKKIEQEIVNLTQNIVFCEIELEQAIQTNNIKLSMLLDNQIAELIYQKNYLENEFRRIQEEEETDRQPTLIVEKVKTSFLPRLNPAI